MEENHAKTMRDDWTNQDMIGLYEHGHRCMELGEKDEHGEPTIYWCGQYLCKEE